MITFDQVSKRFSRRSAALEQVSLDVEEGEFVIIVGESGAGKSTLLKLISREEKPTSGSIVVNGIDYGKARNSETPRIRRSIGFIFQDYKLLNNRTVLENVAFPLVFMGAGRKMIKHRVEKALDIVGLVGKEHAFPDELSGGEKQRVGIARAVIRQPVILIADEPTGNLDPNHSWDIIKILEKINEHGTTVVLTTHNKQIVDKLKKRVITLSEGQVVRDKVHGKYKL